MSTLFEAVRTVVPRLAKPQSRVLEALLYAPSHSSSAGQLRTILGFAAVVQVNGAMGQAGKKVFEILGAHPDGLLDGQYEWWHMLATGEQADKRGFVWTLRQEVVRALIACGLSASGQTAPDEIRGSETLAEGSVRRVVVNAYERNPVARERCIEAHGTACSVCGIEFGRKYGSAAVGYIHVHHLRSLSSIAELYEVDPVQDLRPVCPNCHAVIHMADPAHTIEEVRAMLIRANADAKASS